MFPGVDGFHWTFGHLLFLAIFFVVLLTVTGTVLFAILRSRSKLRPEQIAEVRWREEFDELPARDRSCRHELSGAVDHRTCVNRFECRRCADFARLNHPATAQQDKVCGLSFPANRLYHRGHTWVEPQPDGTLLVGLDEIGSRIMGKPDEVELPAAGTRVSAHGSGWSMKKAGYGVRVLAPVSGEVVETGGPEAGYYLRIKPDTQNPDLRHLLGGAEVQGWVMRELEALQAAFVPAGSAVSLADGGELMNDIISNIPTAAWDTVLGQLFLEP